MRAICMRFDKKTLVLAAFLIILTIGAFFRSYHFSDWMHFELDQSRDANFVSAGVKEGIANLPTLGPKAGGTYLRLGPIFYYFEYVSALVFGNTPSGHAMAVLLLSVASLPLFYIFSRRYFSRLISVLLLAVYAFSLFLILYSRFSWNPNTLPFFMLLSFYAILRATDREEQRKEWWLVVVFLAVTISTQLHFLALMLVPSVCFFYYLLRRTRIKWWGWAVGAFVALLFYVPVIITDWRTDGENFKELQKTLFSKSSDTEHTLPAKVVRTARNLSLGYYLVITGDETAELPEIIVLSRKALADSCDGNCRSHLAQGLAAVLFFSAGSILVLRSLFGEKDEKRKSFAQLMAIWLAISSSLFVPLAFSMFPRFFLLIAPLAIVMLGIILEKIYKNGGYKRAIIAATIIITVIAINLAGILRRFDELERAKNETFYIRQDRILRELVRVTLEQQNAAAEIIKKSYDTNKHPVYLESETTFKRSLSFLLKSKGIVFDGLKTSMIYREGNHFLVLTSVLPRSQKTLDKFLEKYSIVEQTPLGTLTVYKLMPKPENITAEKQDFSKEKKGASGVPERYTWKELFREGGPGKISEAGDEEEKNDDNGL